MGYLTIARLKLLSTAPASYIDEIEAMPGEAGWTMAQIETFSRKLDARLKKRYAAPFDEASPPNVLEQWLADILTPRLYRKRGVDPQDEAYVEAQKAAEDAWAEVKEASESKDGLFELPLRQSDPGSTAITRGAPLGYSEGDPYSAFVNQRDRARDDGVI